MRGRTSERSRLGGSGAGSGLTGWRALPPLSLAIVLLLLGAAPALGGGKSDQGFFVDHDDEFEADGDADIYAGPAPLAVKFSARAIHASGRVSYRWNFDDRTTSSEQNPGHTFSRHGWYSVTLDARDTAGHTYRLNLLLHAWRQKDWTRLQAHHDLRIVQHAARELERKRRRSATAAAEPLSANSRTRGRRSLT
jgi:PKD domain